MPGRSTNASSTRATEDAPLVASLWEIALRVQRQHRSTDILGELAEGLAKLSIRWAFLRVEGSSLQVEAMGLPPGAQTQLESVLGGALSRRMGSLAAHPVFAPLFQEGETAYLTGLEAALAAVLAPSDDALRGRLTDLFVQWDFGPGIVAPLGAGRQTWGALALCSKALSAEDIPTVGLFSAQLAAALATARAGQQLEQKGRALTAVHELSAADNPVSVDGNLPHLLEVLSRNTESEYAAAFLLEADGSQLVQSGSFGDGAPDARSVTLPLVGSQLGEVARGLTPRALPAAASPPALLRQVQALGLRELALVPMQIKGRLTGLLVLGRRQAHPFTQEELAAAALLAEQVAIQLENARVYAGAQRQVRHLSLLFNLARMCTEPHEVHPLVENALEETLGAVGASVATLHLISRGRLVLSSARAAHGQILWAAGGTGDRELPVDDRSLFGRAVLYRETSVADEPERAGRWAQQGLRHAAAAPIMAKHQVLGTLGVARSADQPFADDELRVLESCAGLLGVAIDRARLFDSERQHARDLSTINELGGQIADRLELSSVLRNGVRHLSRLCDVPNVLLFLLQPGDDLLLAATNLEASPELPTRLKLDEPSSATHAIRNLSPVVIANPLEDERANKTFTQRLSHRSVLAVPLIFGGQPIGAVVLGETRTDRPPSPPVVERAVAISNQLAAAIASARLYDDLRRSYQKLTRAQEELVKRERLAAVGELAALVAHEVRNPLAVVFNSLSSLRKLLQPSGEVETLLDILAEEANRLNSMVGDFLDFARPNEPDLQLGSPAGVVKGAVEAAIGAEPPAGIRVEMGIAPDLPTLPFDPRLLRQAVLNLAVNAIQAMPKGGTLSVRASELIEEERRWILLEISDTGGGVDPDLESRLFQPFFTTKATGTGLGLAVVKRIVEAHQGDVAFESKAGHGTTFRIRLPVKRRSDRPVELDESAEAAEAGTDLGDPPSELDRTEGP